MDNQDLIDALNNARSFTVAVEPGVHIVLRTPTPHQVDIAALVAMDAHGHGRASMVATQRALLVGALHTWSGVLQSHLLPSAEPVVLDIDDAAKPALLDARPDWAASLNEQLGTKMAEQNARFEAAKKNLQPI